jgi:DNA topoisomerase-3
MTQEQSAQAKEIKILPNFVEGKTGVHKPSITQGKTTAPKAYNEATFEEP